MAEHHADLTNFSSVEDKKDALQLVEDHYKALSAGQDNWVCNLSNASSLLWHAYKSLNIRVNWAGFYIAQPHNNVKELQELLLGPFQGKVACQTIQFGKGVCGTAAATQDTQVVPDVEKAPSHIACDGDTKSEIVVPIISTETGKTLGVIDIDCVDYNGFNEIDKEYLENLAKLISKTCKF